jgi:uncharacterized membrane protein YfcA
MEIFTFILVACVGLIVGMLSGMFGIGGGTVMIPVLNLVFRLPILAATATSLFVIAPTAISGTIRSLRQGSIDIKSAILIGAPGALTSIFSSYISDMLPALVITIAAGIVILYSAFEMIRVALKGSSKNSAAADESKNIFKTEVSFTIVRVCLGLFAGLVAGIVGVGGGFIIVPISIAYFGFMFKQATGVSLLAIAIIAIPGIITHALLGHIEYLYGLALMVGSIPGANLGVRLIAKIPEKTARVLFGIMLVVSGVMLVVRSLA